MIYAFQQLPELGIILQCSQDTQFIPSLFWKAKFLDMFRVSKKKKKKKKNNWRKLSISTLAKYFAGNKILFDVKNIYYSTLFDGSSVLGSERRRSQRKLLCVANFANLMICSDKLQRTAAIYCVLPSPNGNIYYNEHGKSRSWHRNI